MFLNHSLPPWFLQLDWPMGNGLLAIPIVLEGDIVDHQFAVEEHVHLLPHHDNPEPIPFTNRLIGNFQGIGRILLVIVGPPEPIWLPSPPG